LFPPYSHHAFRLLFLRPFGIPLSLSSVLASVSPLSSSFVSRLFPPYSRPVFRLSLRFILPGIPACHLSSFVSLFRVCARSMVQPTSAILILGLGFLLFSPIDYLGSTRPPFYPPSFLRATRPLPPSIHPTISSCCIDILYRLFWFLGSFPFICLGVTSPWVVEGPSKTSLLSSVFRLG
jgi:hypothetical protein